jgi:PAS domain S-box-containing protein
MQFILNVNDDPARRYLVGRILRDAGFAVSEAATGTLALERARAEAPDLVLLDVKLPDVDGFEVCRRLKADPLTSGIPVIMLSAVLVETVYRVQGLESGADGYLTDPLQPAMVIAQIRALLRARHAEEARRESEAQYGVLFESNPLPVWVEEIESLAILAANEAALRQFGYTREEFHALTAEELRAFEDRDSRVTHSEPIVGETRHWQCRRRDGSAFEADVTTCRMRYQGRDVRLVVALDTTERTRAEARQAVQFAVTRILAESATVAEALPRLLAAIGERLAWDVGEFWGVDATGQSLHLEAVWSQGASDSATLATMGRLLKFGRGVGMPGQIWERHRPVWSPDLGGDPTFARTRQVVEGSLRAAIGFPVSAGTAVSGVMLFFSRHTRRPDPDMLRTMGDLGQQIGQVIERRRAEEALAEAEARYRMAARATNDVIWDWDVTSDRLVVSEAMRERFGYDPASVSSRDRWWRDRVHPDDRARVDAMLHRALEGGATFLSEEYRLQRVTGDYATVMDRACIVRDGTGNAVRIVGALSDITERTLAEERRRLRALSLEVLRAREEQARRIAHELHDEAGQLLASVHITLDRVAAEVPAVDRKRVQEIKQLLDLTEEQLRRIAHELRPTVLDDLGLGPALEILGDTVAARSGLDVDVDATLEERLPPVIETAVYRIAQEALANVVKHARASSVTLRLARDGRSIRCTVADDGVGFTPGTGGTGGLGLIGIGERLEAVAGTLDLESHPGLGTSLTVVIPLDGDDPEGPAR